VPGAGASPTSPRGLEGDRLRRSIRSKEVAVATAGPSVTPVSPTDAVRDAIEHTRRQLFPISPGKWLILGVLSFLDQCGRTFPGGAGGGRGRAPLPGRHGGPGGFEEIQALWLRATEWLPAHAAAVSVSVLAAIAVLALLLAVVLWINSRGVFMYLDAVATGRAQVSRPWREHAGAASSYFGWSLGLTFAGFFVFLFALGLVVTLATGFVTRRLEGPGAWLAAAAVTPVLLLLLLALPLLALARVGLRDFVAPLQIVTHLPCSEAARVLEGLVVAHPGAFVLYLLLKVALVIVTGVVVVVGGCLTCCVGFLPLVMNVLFQPLFFFERSFSLMLLRRMGYDLARSLGNPGA
jgi:hypothetical protein